MDNEYKKNSWMYKLSSFMLREPKNKEQIKKLLHDAAYKNLFSQKALSMLEGVLSMHESRVKDIAVKKVHIVSLFIGQGLDDVLEVIIQHGHSRFPVYQDKRKNDIAGLIHAKDLFKLLKNKENQFIEQQMLRNAVFIPENKRLDSLLNQFRLTRNHMALIIDEYNHVTGLVTIEDVLEQIVGNINDEFDLS